MSALLQHQQKGCHLLRILGWDVSGVMSHIVEADYRRLVDIFGLEPPGVPFTVYVEPGGGGAYHRSGNTTTFFVGVDCPFGASFNAAAMVEVFAAATGNGWVTWFPEEPVTGQPTDLGYVQQDLAVAFPLWQDNTNEWSASANVRGAFCHTQALLPDTRQSFPEELWHVRFGTTYRHQFANGWIGGGTLSVGSASDRPFASIDELFVGASAFLRMPQGKRRAWRFSLTYSPISDLPIPIPGVAYAYQPSERLHAVIGLPLYLMYRPWDPLTLEGSYMLRHTVHVRATYRLVTPVRLSAGFTWANESYLLADRLRDNDRFFAYDKRVTAGAHIILGSHATLDFAGGYIFDRFYFEGEGYSNRNHNRIDVDAGPFASLQVQIKW